MYPDLFNSLVEYFEKLPGVGHKTAIRYAFKVFNFSNEEIDEFSKILKDTKEKITYCEKCHFLSEGQYCKICQDKNRNAKQILVVTYVQDVVAIEKAAVYNGYYHVLGNNISTTKGIMPEDININSLLKRIDENIEEVILAISPTIDGETTSLYIAKLLKDYPCKVTKFAHGLSFGSNLDYTDELTISKAINNRTNLNEV